MLKQLDTLIGLSVVMLVVSLFITIITQFVSSLLGLRGKNLADALEAMIYKIDPDIDTEVKGLAKDLANRVLTHPAVSDSTLSMAKAWPMAWKRASAIRPEELLDVLKRFAGDTTVPAGNPTTIQQAAARLLDGLGKPRGANAFDSAAITNAIEEMRRQLPALAVQKGADAIKEFEAVTNVALGNVEKWFNATQDRAKQWFAMHMRVITVVAAFITAFGLQLDFLKLFDRVTSDAELRARLVASAPMLLKQTQEVFDAADTNSAAICTNALAKLDSDYGGNTNFPNYPLLVTNLASSAEATSWISNRLTAAGFANPKIEEVISHYNQIAGELSAARVNSLVEHYGVINEKLSETGLSLIADPYPAGFWEWLGFNHKIQWLCLHCRLPDLHFLGLFLSAALLSLGAPFWFNALKSLTNLRPLLAQQVDKQPTATSLSTDPKS